VSNDLLMILLLDRWQAGFESPEPDAFDLRDYLKAHLAMRSLPSQIVRENSALTYFCRCSVAWRQGVALYCKAGGVPWKLADPEPETAHIGLSYALRPQVEDGRRFLTCCSQVFDADGAGLEFVAYEAADFRYFGDNPFLSRAEMRRVMARSLALYQARHAGRVPRRMLVHKTTEFKPREVEGAFDALGHIATVDLIQIKQDAGWRGVRIDPPAPDSRRGGIRASSSADRAVSGGNSGFATPGARSDRLAGSRSTMRKTARKSQESERRQETQLYGRPDFKTVNFWPCRAENRLHATQLAPLPARVLLRTAPQFRRVALLLPYGRWRRSRKRSYATMSVRCCGAQRPANGSRSPSRGVPSLSSAPCTHVNGCPASSWLTSGRRPRIPRSSTISKRWAGSSQTPGPAADRGGPTRYLGLDRGREGARGGRGDQCHLADRAALRRAHCTRR
jgi:hypothetical protein